MLCVLIDTLTSTSPKEPLFRFQTSPEQYKEHSMREAVIVSAVRTPLGSFNGTLGNLGATKLGA